MSRTIDADALKDGYMHMGYDPNEHPEESYMEGWCKGFNAAVDHCIGHVIHAPTIEPERQKGKWVADEKRFGDDGYHCDQCGAVLEGNALVWRNNYYCYHCGADMRGEKNEPT